MIIKNGKTISSIYKGSQKISKIYKGTVLVFKDIVQNILPKEYQQLEYIENKRGTNYSYINTGVVPNANTGIDLVFQTDNFSESQYILGVRESTIQYAMNGSQSRDDWDIRFNGSTVYSNVVRTTDKWRSIISMLNGVGTWKLSNLTTDETTEISFSGKKVTATLPLGLFCYNATSPASYTHYGLKVYSCKIYDGETLIRDFVPCYRKSDEVAGLYDLVNGVFYTSDGKGDFIR